MDQERKDAIVMLRHVLQSQPSMFAKTGASSPSGKDVADFCIEFIHEYSERSRRARDQSPQ